MKNRYNDLKSNLRSILSRFRLELLLSDLLKGTAFLAGYVLLYFFVYYCFINFFPVTVFFKSVSFFLFLGGGIFFVVFFLLRPLYLFVISFICRIKRYCGGFCNTVRWQMMFL